MSDSHWGVCAYWPVCRALVAVLGIAIIFASAFPASPLQVEHSANNEAHAIAMSDHAIPADNKVRDSKVHATCTAGACCFAFVVPLEVVSTRIPFRVTIERDAIAQLAARTAAPPLPPPKIMILV